ncbi:MAG: hypothetical protein JWO05_2527 [Gemmatimonadetes bacterium]|nr:hypothetical protein [Gemmatimonadota bacterium]
MPFTLWSRDTLLGSSNLQAPSPDSSTLLGEFEPTTAGLALVPAFTEQMRAMRGITPIIEQSGMLEGSADQERGDAFATQLHESPEGQRLFAAKSAMEALELELRDESGQPMPATQFFVQDVLQAINDQVPHGSARLDKLEPGIPRFVMSVLLQKG